MPESESGGKKTPATERGREREREYERKYRREQSSEGGYGYPDFGGYEFGDARYNSFPRMKGASARIRHTPVEEQIDELLEAVDVDGLGCVRDVSEEVDRQLVDIKAEKGRAGGVGGAVVECVALEDLPAVIQTIAIAREELRNPGDRGRGSDAGGLV